MITKLLFKQYSVTYVCVKYTPTKSCTYTYDYVYMQMYFYATRVPITHEYTFITINQKHCR